MSNHLRKQDLNGNTLVIAGNTFAVKDQIKAKGGSWDANTKTWRIDLRGLGSGRLSDVASLTFAIRDNCRFEVK